MNWKALALALGLSSLACGSGSYARDNPFEGPARERTGITLRVDNLNFNDATLHAVYGGIRNRLGTVSGKSVATFSVPVRDVTDLAVDINLLAAGSWTTPRIAVSPGDRVELQIHADVRRSLLRR